MNLTIFNSWQSDSPHNSKAIRSALREVCNKLESKISDLHIKIDEATSNQTGALHIPNAILQNITNADIFIVDLTTVGKVFEGNKKLQNPNVLIELGYAISQLGWDRIILLFNRQFGEFNDLPFDIEKRSCLDFKIVSSDDKNGIGLLRENLISRIKQIIEVNPEKPTKATLVLDKERSKDIGTVTKVFSWLPHPEMDSLLDHGTDSIKKSLIDNAKQFESFTNSLAFYVSDKRLRKRIEKLGDTWEDFLITLPKDYVLSQSTYTNKNRLKGIRRSNLMSNYLIEDIDKAYVSMLKYVRQNYPEIDI